MTALSQLEQLVGLAAGEVHRFETYRDLVVAGQTEVSIATVPEADHLGACLGAFPGRDHCSLTVICDSWEETPSRRDLGSFVGNWRDAVSENGGVARCHVRLTVSKQARDGVVTLYCPAAFYASNAANGHSVVQFLADTNDLISISGKILLELAQDGHRLELPAAASLPFDPKQRKDVLQFQHENCHFAQLARFDRLTPFDFEQETPVTDETLNALFVKAANFLSVAFVFDVIELDAGNEKLTVKVKGKRTFVDTVALDDLHAGQSEEFFDIARWLYSPGGHWSDKLMLARNIISYHLKPPFYELDVGCFRSILSGFEVYLRENVAVYIELKNKLSDYLIDATQRVEGIISAMGNSMKANVAALFTFLFGLLISSVTSSGGVTLFANSAVWTVTILGHVLSLVLLFLTSWETRTKVARVRSGYEGLKARYRDLVDEVDLASTFDEDRSIAAAERQVELQRKIYFWAWVGILVVAFAVLALVHFEVLGE